MIFQLDRGLKLLFEELTGLNADLSNPRNSDIIISSNSWAFRNRIRQKRTLELPFINFRILPGQPIKLEKNPFPKNYFLANHGIYNPDSETRETAKAFTARYEATYWGHKFTRTVEMFQKIFSKNYNDILCRYNYVINNETLSLKAPFEFTNLELDPQWTAAEELERGKIHSIDLSFEVDAFLFESIDGKGANNVNYVAQVTAPTNDTIVTVTSPNHGLTSGAYVTVEGFTNSAYDGRYQVTVIDNDTFKLNDLNATDETTGTLTWYSGVKPVDTLVWEMFYDNGTIDETTGEYSNIFQDVSRSKEIDVTPDE